MTRGKYAARAAKRREDAEIEATEAGYRRQIVRLTQERDEARAERDDARKVWKDEVRVLAAQLSEATSPRVDALNRELIRTRDERDRFKAELVRLREAVNRAALRDLTPGNGQRLPTAAGGSVAKEHARKVIGGDEQKKPDDRRRKSQQGRHNRDVGVDLIDYRDRGDES